MILNHCLTCSRPGIVVFQTNPEFPSLFNFNDFQLKSIYSIPNETKVCTEISQSKSNESWCDHPLPRAKFIIYLERKCLYYVSNVCVPIGLLSGLCLISMSINEDGTRLDTSSRLAITLTLLLTGVAYKFVVADSLPNLSYLTLPDKYIWSCFAFTLAVVLENAVVPSSCGVIKMFMTYIAWNHTWHYVLQLSTSR